MLGVEWSGYRSSRIGSGAWMLSVPCYVVVLVLAVPLAVMRLRRRQLRDDCCLSCGYDMRATPERCPECGITSPSMSNAVADTPTFSQKHAEWVACLDGSDRNSVMNQITRMIWDAAAFRVVNEAKRSPTLLIRPGFPSSCA